VRGNRRIAAFFAGLAVVLWFGTAVAAWVDGAPFWQAALLAAAVVAGSAILAGLVFAGLEWVVQGDIRKIENEEE